MYSALTNFLCCPRAQKYLDRTIGPSCTVSTSTHAASFSDGERFNWPTPGPARIRFDHTATGSQKKCQLLLFLRNVQKTLFVHGFHGPTSTLCVSVRPSWALPRKMYIEDEEPAALTRRKGSQNFSFRRYGDCLAIDFVANVVNAFHSINMARSERPTPHGPSTSSTPQLTLHMAAGSLALQGKLFVGVLSESVALATVIYNREVSPYPKSSTLVAPEPIHFVHYDAESDEDADT